LTVQTGDTFTFNGDAFTDLTGTGLQISAGALQTTLGTSVDLITEVTGILPIANGGTNSSTAQGAINNLSGLTTNGDLLYHNGTNSTRLARGTNGQCLTANATTIVWGSCGGGVTTIGTIDSQTKSANGAVISGASLFMQTADATNPGLVSTTTQTFAGAKTFSTSVTSPTINATTDFQVNGTSAITADSYLRINQSNQFSNGIWFGSSPLRAAAGGVYLGSAGGDGQIALIPTAADQTRRITLNGGDGSAYFAGNIGIGVTSADTTLHVAGSTLNARDNLNFYRNVAHYNNTGGAQTGTMKIAMPTAKSWSNTMVSVTIRGYDYSTNGNWEVVASGFNWSNPGWINADAEIKGAAPFTQVRLAHDGTRNVILLGTTSTVWQFAQVAVVEVAAGYSSITGWGDGWAISVIASEAGITNSVAPTIPMYITDTGNLGIGTTAPGSYRLNVQGGDVNFSGDLTVGGGDITISGTSTITAGGAQSNWTAATINGTKGGYGGLNFRNGATNLGSLLVDTNIQGFINDADNAWDWYFSNGTLTVGTIPVANLSGLTTAGDLLYYNGTTNTRLARGTNGQCLTSNTTTIVWGSCGSGVTTIGAIDSQTKSANGAVISGVNLYMQTADASNPGLVSTGTQTFAGAKTFNNTVTVQGGAFDLTLNDAGSELRILESVGGAFYGSFDVGDLSADRTYTFPDSTGEVCVAQLGNCFSFGFGGDINAVGDVASGGAFDGTAGNNLHFEGTVVDGFEVTLTASNPGADFTITLPAANGTVCLTSGNCSGVGGNGDITGNGTAGVIAKFSATKNIVDSIMSESGSTITVAGTLNATTALQTNSITRITNTGVLQNVTYNGNTIAVTYGGTGASSFTANGILYGNSAGALGVTAAGTTGQCLNANTGLAPTWGSCGSGGSLTLQNVYDNSGSPASILLATGKNLVITSPDVATDPNILFNLQCAACGSGISANGRFGVQINGADTGFNVFSNGNVSIGASNATYRLTVLTAAQAAIFESTDSTAVAYYGLIDTHRQVSTNGSGQGISFGLNNSSSVRQEYGYIGALIQGNTAGSENGALVFTTTQNGSTRQERIRVSAEGYVGIGETGPVARLQVKETNSAQTIAIFHHTDTGTSAFFSMMNIQRNTSTTGAGMGISFYGLDSTSASTQYAYIGSAIELATNGAERGAVVFYTQDTLGGGIFERGRVSYNSNVQFGINATSATTTLDIGGSTTTSGVCHSGGLTATNDVQIVDCSSAPSDIAEWYEMREDTEAGDVVAVSNESFTYGATQTDPYTGAVLPDKVTTTISKLEKSTTRYSGKLIGVVSSAPYQVYGEDILEQGSKPKPIALKGRVPVKVTDENGPIAPGDPLTSSSKPGYAMKATQPGAIIGKALAHHVSGEGKVEVFVGLAYFSPDGTEPLQGSEASFESLTVTGISTLEELRVTHATIAGTLIVSGDATFQGNVTIVGDLTTANIKIDGVITGNPNTRGEIVIPAGQTSFTYEFAAPFETKPFVVASPVNKPVLYRVESSETGFTIHLNNLDIEDIVFNYMMQL
jgi:hypothetical protein